MAGIHNALIGTGKTRPAFVSASAVATSGTRLVTITAPTSIVAGNLLIALVYGAANGTYTESPASGWSVLINDSPNRYIATKIATASEPTSYTMGFNSGVWSALVGVIVQYTGASIDVASASSASVTDPTVSINVTDNLSLLLGFVSANTTANTFTAPTPGTWTNRSLRGTAPSEAIYDREIGAGSTGTVTFGTTTACRANLISLSPL